MKKVRSKVVKTASKIHKKHYTGRAGLYNTGVMRMLSTLILGPVYMSQAYINELQQEFVAS